MNCCMRARRRRRRATDAPHGGVRAVGGQIAVTVFLLLGFLSFPCSAQKLPPDDKVFKAMKDELDRTMRKLRMEDMPGPYLVSYAVREGTRAYIGASFGSLQTSQESAFMDVRAEVRVGDYGFDNTHFIPSGSPFGAPSGLGSASFEEDYDNLRFTLWSLSDGAYKNALENMAKKKAFREKRMITEVCDDLSREKPVESYEKPRQISIARGLWERRVKDISAVFRRYPDIQESYVALSFESGVKRLLTSEGTAVRGSDAHIAIDLSVNTQAEDGLRIGDSASLHYPGWGDVPGVEVLEAAARRLAQGVADAVRGSTVAAYVGPVMFEGQAAAEFFDVLLVDNISNPRGSWSEDEHNRIFDPPPFVSRLGMRVAVPFLSFVDDPLLERYEGIPLFGHYRIDDEGVPARRLELVRKGKLTDLYMSRAPARERQSSNGHGRAAFFGEPSGRMGNLVVTPENPVPLAELKARLRDICRELELDYGIVVREMVGLDPVVAYKVYSRDGREEPLRGVEFTGAGLRPLRDIVAASKEMYVFNFYHGSNGRTSVPASIAAPSILVREMEVKKTERKPDKLPYLKHPYFAQKGTQ